MSKQNQNKINSKTLKLKQIVKSANYDQMPTLGIHSPQKFYRTLSISFLPLLVQEKVKPTQLRNHPETFNNPT